MGETGWNQMARLGLQGNVRVCVRWKCVSQIEFFRAAWGLLWVLCQVSLQVLSRVLFQGNLRVFCFSSFFSSEALVFIDWISWFCGLKWERPKSKIFYYILFIFLLLFLFIYFFCKKLLLLFFFVFFF